MSSESSDPKRSPHDGSDAFENADVYPTIDLESDSVPGSSTPVPTVPDDAEPTVDYSGERAPSTLGKRLGKRSGSVSPGDRFGHYELLEEIARGGMGVVYKARQDKLNRVVALKMILSGQFASSADIDRFYTEAEAAARLDHTGIVPIFEVDEIDGQHYYSMGFVDGPSLSERAAAESFAPRDAADLMCRIAVAVQYAHDNGIVHRDLKPRNILLTKSGEPKITDFGLAAKMEANHELTASGQILGTPSYMPPEQAAGRVKDIGPHSDVYGLGAILYFLLTGRPPFQTGSVVETIKQVLESDPVKPRLLNPSVDRDLETICLKCLEKNAANRYESAAEFGADLQRFLDGEPIQARRIGLAGRTVRWMRRKPMAAALYASVVVIVIALAISGLVARRSIATWRFASLNRQFEEQLEHIHLSDQYLTDVEELLTELEQLSPEEASESRPRLYASFASSIRAEIRSAKHEAEDIQRINQAIALLNARDAGLAKKLTTEFERRQSQWDTLVHLQSPFSDWDKTFRDSSFTISNNGQQLILKDDKDDDKANRRVATSLPCPGTVQIAAKFGDGWEQSHRVGVALNARGKQAYEFLLTSEETEVDRRTDRRTSPSSKRSFAEVRAEDGYFHVMITRNGLPLVRQEIHHAKIPSEPVMIRGARQRGQLTIQINLLGPRRFRDPFPISASKSGFFALDLAPGVGLLDFQAECKTRAPEPSALEHGDELLDQEQFEQAFAFFQQQTRESSGSQHGLEARYKQAICLIGLNRLQEAEEILQQIITESDDLWPPLAGCQLWVIYLEQNKVSEAEAIYRTLASRFRFEQFAALVPEDLRWKILSAYRQNFQTVSAVLRYDSQLVQKMERLAAVDRLFSADGQGQPLTQIEVSRAYRYMGDLPSALRVVESLAAGTTNSTVMRHYSRLLRLTGQPQEALHQFDQAFSDPLRAKMQEDALLLIEKSRVHAALGHWDRCEQLIDQLYLRHRYETPMLPHNFSYLAMIKGFLLERRGAKRAALGIWREGFRAMQPMLGKTRGVQADLLNGLILGSLTGELTGEDAQAFFSRTVVGGGENPILRLAEAMVSPKTIQTCMQQMWRSDIGHRYAEAFAFETLTMRQRIMTPAILMGITYFRESGTNGDSSPATEELLFQQLESLFDELFVGGRINAAQAAQLSLSWKGTTNFLGWAGVAPTLLPEHRCGIAYFMAHRFLRLKNQPQAIRLFETTLADAKPDSALAKTAARDLELLKAGEAMLTVTADFAAPEEVVILQGDREVQRVQLAVHAQTRLPAGDYRIEVPGLAAECRISKQEITLAPGCERIVSLQWIWQSDSKSQTILGVIPQPSSNAVDGRWQLFARQPGTLAQAVAWSPNERWIAVGTNDGAVRLLDADDYHLDRILAGHGGSLQSICWRGDSECLASFDAGHQARIWSIETGAMEMVIDHGTRIDSLAWDPSGDTLATGGRDRKIHFWSPSGRKLRTWSTQYEVRSIAWSFDGQRIASTGWINEFGNVVDIWNANDDQIEQRIIVGQDSRESLAWSPDGHWLAVAGPSDRVTLYSTTDWAVAAAFPSSGQVMSLEFATSGEFLSALIREKGIATWNLADLESPPVERFDASDLRCGDISPSGDRFAISGGSVQLAILNRQSGESLFAWTARRETTALAVSPVEGRVAIGGPTGWVHLLDPASDRHLASIPAQATVRQLAWSHGGDRLAIGLANGVLEIVDLDGSSVAKTRVADGRSIESLVWNPTDNGVLVADHSKQIQCFDISENKLIPFGDQQPDWLSAVACSESGHVFLGDASGNIRHLDSEGKQIGEYHTGRGGSIQRIAIGTKLNQVAVINSDKRICVVSLEVDRDPVYLDQGQEAREIAWSPDSKQLAAVTNPGDLRVWDDRGELRMSRRINTSRLESLVWLSDSRTILCGGDSATIQAWDVAKQEPRRVTLLLPDGETAVFQPSGRAIRVPQTFQDEAVYAVETESGGLELLAPDTFHTRFQLPWPPASLSDNE